MTGKELKQIRTEVFGFDNLTQFAKMLGYGRVQYAKYESYEDEKILKRLEVTILALRALHNRNRHVFDELIRILKKKS